MSLMAETKTEQKMVSVEIEVPKSRNGEKPTS